MPDIKCEDALEAQRQRYEAIIMDYEKRLGRGTTIARVLQKEPNGLLDLAVVHVEATEQGLVIYVK